MKSLCQTMSLLLCVMGLCGCRTTYRSAPSLMEAKMPPAEVYGSMAQTSGMSGASPGAMTEVRPERMMVWTAHLNIQAQNVSNALDQVIAMVEAQGGFVEKRSDTAEDFVCLAFRIPIKSFKSALAGMHGLGTVTSQRVDGDDVTDQYIDVEARLKNKIALRDRLTQLLSKATDVKDILEIEMQLNRVQADIDSMDGRIKALKGKTDFATIYLTLCKKVEKRPRILGPLGYLFTGLWWGIEKLFVISE